MGFIRERDMATHRMGFAVIGLGLLCFILAARLWRMGRRRTAIALGFIGGIVSMTGCAYASVQTMI